MNPQFNPVTETEWSVRLAELREAEWKTRCKLQQLGDEIVKRATAAIDEQKITLAAGIGLLESASKFGRLAVEGVEEPPRGENAQEQWMKDLHGALDALYREIPGAQP